MYGSDSEFETSLKNFQPRPPDPGGEPALPRRESNTSPDGIQRRADPRRRTSGQANTADIGPYFRMPYRLFSSGLGAKLGPSAGWLYAALCSYANDHSSLTFSVSNKTISSDTGMSARTIGEAKRELRERCLIEYSSKPGSRDQFTLKRPELERIKRGERTIAKKKPRGKTGKANDPSEWGELLQILRGTSVDYARPYRKICASV